MYTSQNVDHCNDSRKPDRLPKFGGIAALTVSICLIGTLWLVFLPWLAHQPRMKSRLDWLEQRKIDPSAMYYTELEAMEGILQKQRSRRRQP